MDADRRAVDEPPHPGAPGGSERLFGSTDVDPPAAVAIPFGRSKVGDEMERDLASVHDLIQGGCVGDLARSADAYRRGDRVCLRGVVGERVDDVPFAVQTVHVVGAQEPRGAGDRDAHYSLLEFSVRRSA